MIFNLKIFFMLQFKGSIFYFNGLDLKKFGIYVNISKYFVVEVYIMGW